MNTLRHILSRARRQLPRTARIATWFRPRAIWRRLRLFGRNREEVFNYIYEKRIWNSTESVSGAGSTLQATAPLRKALPELLSSLGVRSLLDAPCGDFHWLKEVDLDLDLYIGGEIVRPLVDRLNEIYGNESRRFVHLDVTRDPLPDADAILCRDCLLHLSHDDVRATLDNVLRSSCSYLLASTYPDCSFNADIRTGLARPLNLCRPPFDLPDPIRVVEDPGLHIDEKCLGVWDLRQLRSPQGRRRDPLG